MRTVSIIALLAAAALTSCREPFGASEGAGEAARLEALIPVLESYRVKAYRYENWCRALDYRRGRFSSSTTESCTGILDGHRRDFDMTARRDMEAIRKVVRSAGIDIHLLHDMEYGEDGRMIRGIFDCSGDSEDRIYVYQPNYTLPDPPPGMTCRPINANWYYQGHQGRDD